MSNVHPPPSILVLWHATFAFWVKHDYVPSILVLRHATFAFWVKHDYVPSILVLRHATFEFWVKHDYGPSILVLRHATFEFWVKHDYGPSIMVLRHVTFELNMTMCPQFWYSGTLLLSFELNMIMWEYLFKSFLATGRHHIFTTCIKCGKPLTRITQQLVNWSCVAVPLRLIYFDTEPLDVHQEQSVTYTKPSLGHNSLHNFLLFLEVKLPLHF